MVIRENFSRRIALLASLPMATVDIVSYAAEYSGIAIGMGLVGVPPIVSMPIAYAAHIAIILRRRFVSVEKALFAVATVLILSYAGSLFVRGVSPSDMTYFSADPQFLFLLAASAGAVVMPFMLFHQASASGCFVGNPSSVNFQTQPSTQSFICSLSTSVNRMFRY